MASKKTAEIAEFGDFQTPQDLCVSVCRYLKHKLPEIRSVIEPTCGRGNFLLAALKEFPRLESVVGVDIDDAYIGEARNALVAHGGRARLRLDVASFFEYDWASAIEASASPFLILGNPPWVTNAHIGALGGSNLPKKTNFQGHNGFDAITGKANFDISEWMLIQLLDRLEGSSGSLAMLCKTAVARKSLVHAWKHSHHVADAEVVLIDAMEHFGAAVDACLLYVRYSRRGGCHEAIVRRGFDGDDVVGAWGYRKGVLLADVRAYEKWRHLWTGSSPTWRSGIKHDCSSVMELRPVASGLLENGLGEVVDIEPQYVYPLLKSSHVSKPLDAAPPRFMIVTQRSVGADTSTIESAAPRTWAYLQAHAAAFAKRASSIYRDRPPFSIFGVGEYSFAPWKVAIAGLYKTMRFTVVGPYKGKPFVLDDTCYFVACSTEGDARALAEVLGSDAAREALGAFVFWDAKRPITVDVLRRLDAAVLAQQVLRDPAAIKAVERCQNGVSGQIVTSPSTSAGLFTPAGT